MNGFPHYNILFLYNTIAIEKGDLNILNKYKKQVIYKFALINK